MSECVSYAVEQRLRFIDFIVDEYGRFNRSTVMRFFGVSQVTATRDIKQYQESAPLNINYSLSKRAYFKSDTFEKVYQ